MIYLCLLTFENSEGIVFRRFTYTRAVHIDDEVTARTSKASVAFGRLRTNVWEQNGIRLDTKLKSTRLLCCQSSYMHVRHGQCTNAMPSNLTIST